MRTSRDAGEAFASRRRTARTVLSRRPAVPAPRGRLPPTSARRSASGSPHQGARSTASHAARSAAWHSARVRATRSCTPWRSPSGSMSTARKRSPASRSAGTIRSRCVRLRTRMAILVPGRSRAALAHQFDDPARLFLAGAVLVVPDEGMPGDRIACERRVERLRRREAHRPLRLVVPRRAGCRGRPHSPSRRRPVASGSSS